MLILGQYNQKQGKVTDFIPEREVNIDDQSKNLDLKILQARETQSNFKLFQNFTYLQG